MATVDNRPRHVDRPHRHWIPKSSRSVAAVEARIPEAMWGKARTKATAIKSRTTKPDAARPQALSFR